MPKGQRSAGEANEKGDLGPHPVCSSRDSGPKLRKGHRVLGEAGGHPPHLCLCV